MKNILVLLIIVIALGTACKKSGFLDNKADTAITEAYVFSDSLRTIQFLTRIYQDAGFSYRKWRWNDHGNTEEATDDAEYNYSGTGQMAVILYSGTISPSNFPAPMTDFWDLPFANIRRVNLFISKVGESPLSARLKARMAAEARFLRAWYYHTLLCTFGGVPLLEDKVFTITDVINAPRNTYAECVGYVVKELDEAAALLPEPNADASTGRGYDESEYGRITKGACLALKSRVLLYAASPLFNGGAVTTDAALAKVVSFPTYDAGHWQRAADAADAVIKANYYALEKDNTTAPGYGFYNVFLKRVNREFIFVYNRPDNRDWEGFYFPPTRGGAKYATPSHNIVAAFPMKNGKNITDPASGYTAANPYANRDPRMAYSIIYNGSLVWLGSATSRQPVWTYDGAPSDGYSDNSSQTGYYTSKMCNVENGGNTQRGWAIIRHAEILLNYAEAINETGQTGLAYPKLVELRERAGIDPGTDGLYGIPANMTKEEMRAFIQNERRIELAFEDHRWNDVRRWKTAMVTNNGFNQRMRPVRNANGTFTYTVVNSIRRHNFRPEMYLLPIPVLEIRRMPAMVQNPGW